jgi:pimeloyl-ACP methyl ester carboxylesterase
MLQIISQGHVGKLLSLFLRIHELKCNIYLHRCQAFLVGTDLGSFPAYMIAVLYPERVTSLVSLGVPFRLPGPSDDIDLMPEGFYCKRWQVCCQCHRSLTFDNFLKTI